LIRPTGVDVTQRAPFAKNLVLKTALILLTYSIWLFADSEDYPYENSIPKSIHPVLHFGIPALSAFGFASFIGLFNRNASLGFKCWVNGGAGFLVGISESIAKESFDASLGYQPDPVDLSIGFSGALTGAGCYVLCAWFRQRKKCQPLPEKVSLDFTGNSIRLTYNF
jgi:hypothetical protein